MARDGYHHGDLRRALLDAGHALADEGGPSAVTVREAARRVGVSAPAAYRHFDDRDRFLGAVGRRCREDLARAMIEERDRHRSPMRRFRATGSAYIAFAVAHPGLLATGWSGEDADGPDDPDALAVLIDALDRLVDAGRLGARRRVGADLVAWSSVHGLAMILVTSPWLAELNGGTQAMIDRVLDGVDDALGLR